jgi:AcrR family transcriptional regulator
MARRSDHSREEIQHMAIEAAIVILNREGISGLSTRKVAGAIGYTAGTLYLVFQNLDELLMHVNAATLDELYKSLARQINEATEPRQVIRQMAFAYLDFARTQHARWSLLFTHQLPQGQQIPSWFDKKVSELFGLVGLPLKKLAPGLSDSECKRGVRVLWSGVHGACDLGLSDKLSLGGAIETEEIIDSLINNYLAGLLRN